MRCSYGMVVLICALLTFVSGCARFDRFGSRAIEFNRQVADTQDRTLLLNIVRAANRYPMHFTELSTLTGTSTVTGTGSLSLPFATFRTQTGDVLSGTPGLSVAESPTFNVAVLETQEFYQGMLKPLSTDQIATYVMEGLPPELVFTLMVGDIVYQKKPGEKPIVIDNNFHPLDDEAKSICPDGKANSQYECFQSILRALIGKGLTLEQVKSTSNVGALLASDSFKDIKWLSGLDPKAFKFAPVTAEDCKLKADVCPEGLDALPKEQRTALNAGETLFRVQKEGSEFRFCFDQAFRQSGDGASKYVKLVDRIQHASIGDKLICQNRLTEDNKKQILKDARAAEDAAKPAVGKTAAAAADDMLAATTLQQFNALSRSSFGFADSPVPKKPDDVFSVQVRPRSTEGVIYYLGEVARCELGLDSTAACGALPAVHVANHPGKDDSLFQVEQFKPELGTAAESDKSVQVDWWGNHYRVQIDPSATDRSGQVLRVVTQLLALNRSAKDFPTPTVIPIISR